MGSFLPILWPKKELVTALLISALTLVLAIDTFAGERLPEMKDLAFIASSLISLWLLWALILTKKTSIEAAVRAQNASLSTLILHLQATVESDRLALSQDLHDELGAILTIAKFDVARLSMKIAPLCPSVSDYIVSLNESLDAGLTLKTRIVEDLRPPSLLHLGLKTTLEKYIDDFVKRTNLVVTKRLALASLSDKNSLVAFRIVQESLTNVVRHAQASRVLVTVQERAFNLEIVIEDDGIGFDPDASTSKRFGISGMKHRVNAVGGKFEISSSSRRGTTVRANIPKEYSSPQQLNPTSWDTRFIPKSILATPIL
jgi:signal transduction histidine kinase